ncbi:MAG: hypothetical protein AAF431_08165 [Pseudomonadota bacterium]
MTGRRTQLIDIGIVLWISFISAGVATMLFFATFDPVEIAQLATFPLTIDRTAGYSLGFLLFWLLLVVNSGAILWLARNGLHRRSVEARGNNTAE